MKNIAIILSLIILGMALFPCADQHDVDLPNLISLSQSHPHDSSSQCQDFCSPFCVCNCCGSNGLFNKIFSLPALYTPSTQIIIQSGNKINYTFQLLPGVWEPPKFLI